MLGFQWLPNLKEGAGGAGGAGGLAVEAGWPVEGEADGGDV